MTTTTQVTVVALGLALGVSQAGAQEFPADDDAWQPFRCGAVAMTDPANDQQGTDEALDVVGDGEAPAAFRALDDDYLYLRLRLDVDPAPGGTLAAFGWGVAFDLDEDLASYEVLVLAREADAMVSVYSNETTTLPDDPADPPDTPAVASYPFADHGRSVAAGSSFDDEADGFLDLAVPWADLEPLGIEPLARVAVWVGTSSDQVALDADLACTDGGGGPSSLGDAASDRATVEPESDDTGTVRLEGGGGCATDGGAGALGALGTLLAGLVARRRRR